MSWSRGAKVRFLEARLWSFPWSKIIHHAFARWFYGRPMEGAPGPWHQCTWLGVPTLKCPLDLWIYQEILWTLKPSLIIESGTAFGGSALFLAGVCEAIGRGHIVSIDIQAHPDRPRHPRITYLLGDSTSGRIVDEVRALARAHESVMVILDSDHRRDHVLCEMRCYAPLVSRGHYLIVEDTNINGHPVLEDFGPGPMEAVELFLKENHDFLIDLSRERFGLTFNPRGFLKRIR